MKLADWMTKNKLTDAAMAELVGRDRTTVLRWRKGETRPDFDALTVIEKVTKRKVRLSDFAEAA
jgi:transcriptional regulator with XRE-family HTH domain